MSNQKQSSGDGSTNIQASTVNYVAVTGVTAPEVYAIARQVFVENFPRLTEEANRLALARAEELVNEFIKVASRKGGRLAAVADPDFQYSLLSAQRDYARSGAEDLKRLLADLLVRRSSTDGDLEKVVIAESLETVRKLTRRQIAALSLSWLITRAVLTEIESIEDFLAGAKRDYAPFVSDLPVADAEYQHLQYAGCATLNSNAELGEVFAAQLPGLFQRGFMDSAVPEQLWHNSVRDKLFTRCFHEPGMWQIRAVDEERAYCIAEAEGLAEYADLYAGYLVGYQLSSRQIEEWLSNQGGFWPEFISVWRKTKISEMYLSSVGMAIGHANWATVTGDATPLSVWITEIPPVG